MDYATYHSQLQYFTSSDGKMAYLDKGKGEAILLIHGVPTSSWLYRNISTELLKKGFRVIAPDMLGFGASDKPKGYKIYSAENTGKRILELMDFLQIESWVHVFHDGGGLWSWEMMQQNASRINSMVMLNSIVYQDGFQPPLKFEQGLIGKIYAKLYSTKIGQAIVLNATFKNGVSNKKVVNKTMLEGYKKPLLKKGNRAMYYFFTQTCQAIEDYAPLHQSLDIPLCVIWGAEDDILVWEDIKTEVKNNFKLLPEDIHILKAKHFIQEEDSLGIANIIVAFAHKH